jgi:transcriptional regulator with XRE-family HTH domain
VEDKFTLLQKKLGINIAARRKSLGWTQEFLAHQLEVDTETISRIERGVTCPSLKTLVKISTLLAITIADLLDEAPPSTPSHIEVTARLLEPLQDKDRAFVMEWLRSLSHYFANTRNN